MYYIRFLCVINIHTITYFLVTILTVKFLKYNISINNKRVHFSIQNSSRVSV